MCDTLLLLPAVCNCLYVFVDVMHFRTLSGSAEFSITLVIVDTLPEINRDVKSRVRITKLNQLVA